MGWKQQGKSGVLSPGVLWTSVSTSVEVKGKKRSRVPASPLESVTSYQPQLCTAMRDEDGPCLQQPKSSNPLFLGGTSGKESACECWRCKTHRFNPLFRKTPQSRKWQSTPVFLPEKFQGQRSPEGYSPWGCKRVGHD